VAKQVLKMAYVAINGVDRSSWTSKTELTVEYEEKDFTVWTSGGAKEVQGGLEGGKLALTFKNDIAAGQLDETMWAMRNTVVPFEVRVNNTAVSTSNPKYTGSVFIGSWTPISGSPGDANEASFTYTCSGLTTRATS
jgi:hypothetical protein